MRIRQYIKRLATLTLMVVALALPTGAWGQVKGDKYVKEIRVSNFTVDLVGEGVDGSNINAAFDGK